MPYYQQVVHIHIAHSPAQNAFRMHALSKSGPRPFRHAAARGRLAVLRRQQQMLYNLQRVHAHEVRNLRTCENVCSISMDEGYGVVART